MFCMYIHVYSASDRIFLFTGVATKVWFAPWALNLFPKAESHEIFSSDICRNHEKRDNRSVSSSNRPRPKASFEWNTHRSEWFLGEWGCKKSCSQWWAGRWTVGMFPNPSMAWKGVMDGSYHAARCQQGTKNDNHRDQKNTAQGDDLEASLVLIGIVPISRACFMMCFFWRHATAGCTCCVFSFLPTPVSHQHREEKATGVTARHSEVHGELEALSWSVDIDCGLWRLLTIWISETVWSTPRMILNVFFLSRYRPNWR